jgi:hypothetical protein
VADEGTEEVIIIGAEEEEWSTSEQKRREWSTLERKRREWSTLEWKSRAWSLWWQEIE